MSENTLSTPDRAATETPAMKRKQWVAPTVTELPALTHLTLQSAAGGGTGDAIGGSGGSGGLVF